ncbi:MAG: glycoside hydrolase family 5 protein [Treponema sp.]|nr:glycoside hydrolase family 5 protein [Treponema sp.]
MKRILIFITALVFFSCNSTDNSIENNIEFLTETGTPLAALRSAPFSKGVNFSGWFEVLDAQRIPFTQYTEQDFADVKSLGADVIRLPVRLNDMTNGAPNYTLDPLLLKLLDMAVDWAQKYGLYLIIDNHSFHPVNHTPNDVDKVLIPVWSQIARRYRNRGNFLIYEILNEPHGIPDERWGEIQGRAIDAIRAHDQRKWIIVGGTDYNSVNKLSSIPNYQDPFLIYTFHFYDPFLFTHQGASWSPPLEHLSGVPFPFNAIRMPRFPSVLRGTWVEGAFRNYAADASTFKLLDVLDKVVAFSRERNVPVFCGEYGVFIPNSPPNDRIVWYDFVTKALDKRNISRTSWDYYGGFGIFNFDGKGDFNTDVNVAIVQAMGFKPPEQIEKNNAPLTSGFVIFDDFPGRDITSGFWGSANADFSFYDTTAADGEFAIRMSNFERYNAFWFSFPRNGNFTELASRGFYLEFKVRTLQPVQFDVRFIMEENADSIPWRYSFTVNRNNLTPNGRWQTIRVPLNQMVDQGAWVNLTQTWLDPRGDFKWDNINRLEFAAEHEDLTGISIWFDSIKVIR